MLKPDNRSVYDYTMTTKYACKELFVKCIFDPILSGEMNEFLYNYLNRKKSIKVVSFSFNDVEKYIDIKVTGDTGKLTDFINEGFKNLYCQWALSNDFLRLYALDSAKAEIFRDIVTNNLDSIASYNFTLYSCILILSYNHDLETNPYLTVRIKLV